ncbi:MAG: hypothetical protein RSB50_08115 [Cetobacterium sp.]
MKQIWACLTGNWVCLNDDPSCVMGGNRSSPDLWYEEGAEIWSPLKRDSEHSYYQSDYIHIQYKGQSYRINPIFIQIVGE